MNGAQFLIPLMSGPPASSRPSATVDSPHSKDRSGFFISSRIAGGPKVTSEVRRSGILGAS